ncbi:MAG: transglycosylase SLT domain-containing protein [Elainellaceae cyanobacterium]
MGRKNKIRLLIAAGAGLVLLLVGTASIMFWRSGSRSGAVEASLEASLDESLNASAGAVSALAVQLPEGRRQALEAIAAGQAPGPNETKPTQGDRLQARYLLASDLLAKGEVAESLSQLKGLDRAYPTLAPYVLVQQARAQAQSGESSDAQATWQRLLKRHGDHPVAAEALYALGKAGDGTQADEAAQAYLQQAIADFPAHPRTVAWAQASLAEDPNQPELLLVLARHGRYLPEIEATLDRLTQAYKSQLQPEDWETIGFAYWEMQRYGKAGQAYARAPQTPLNLYRAGRGAHLDDRREDAISRYQALSQAFPDAEETAQGLLHLARLSKLEASLPYTDRVVEAFPEWAAEALLLRAEILERLDSPQSASQVRQTILQQYGDSDTAAELRWVQAQRAAEAADLVTAWRWATEIVKQNPENEYAPAAAFWVGRWASQLGKPEEAKMAYEYVLRTYPESYYAWRSATSLGWDVGDFATARHKQPTLAPSAARSPLPTGSETLQVLYQLGQDQDAWALWQVEYDNPVQPTVAQQMTDGLLRLGVGDNLEGIFMLSSLDWRAESTDEFSEADAKASLAYWRGLYPFPFRPLIEAWSTEYRLNPALVTALIRQESRFEPEIQSSADAKGLMQVIPPTAEWVAGQLGLSDYQLTNPEDNIQLGTWYLNYTHEEYGDNSLYAVASYNAGPGNVADWIARFDTSDPDRFIARIPFSETKGYVQSVFENYWNYLRLYNPTVIESLSAYSKAHTEVVADLRWLEEPEVSASEEN